MTVGRLLMLIAWTFACPGVGQGAAGRRLAMFGWAAAGLVSLVAFTWSLWALPVALAIRALSALDASVRLVRQRRAGEGAEDLNLPLIASAIGVAGFLHFQFLTDRFRIPASSMLPTIAVGDQVSVDKLTILWQPPERGEVIVFEHPCENRSYIKRVIGIAGDTVEVRCNKVYVNGKAIEGGNVEGACAYTEHDAPDHAKFTRACSRYRETLDGHTYETFHDADRPARDGATAATGAAGPLGSTASMGDTKDFPSLDRIVHGCASQRDGRSGANTQPVGKIVETRPAAAGCEPQLHYVVPAASVFTLGDNRANSNDSRYWGVVPLGKVTGRAIGIVWPLGRTGTVD